MRADKKQRGSIKRNDCEVGMTFDTWNACLTQGDTTKEAGETGDGLWRRFFQGRMGQWSRVIQIVTATGGCVTSGSLAAPEAEQ